MLVAAAMMSLRSDVETVFTCAVKSAAVEATVDGRSVGLGAPKRRQLLALLALSAGRPLAVDNLIEELWAGDPPSSAVNTLQTYVSQLRNAVAGAGGDGACLERRGNGYLLTVAPDDVDQAMPPDTAQTEFTVILTVQTMNYLHSGRHRVVL